MTGAEKEALRAENVERRARKEAATPGPWKWQPRDLVDDRLYEKQTGRPAPSYLMSLSDDYAPDGEVNDFDRWPMPILRCEGTENPKHTVDGAPESPDAAFIAAARNDPVEDRIDMLLAEVERLQQAEMLATKARQYLGDCVEELQERISRLCQPS